MLTFIPQSLREINILSITVRAIMAIFIGGLVGMERGRKRRPAGVRTHMLVTLGACLVMCTNQYIYQIDPSTDLTRMGAQVISGIGFLCAGTIILTGHNFVIGLTTAAGLWTSACVGLAIGIGFYEGAIVVAVSIILILIVFQNIDTKILISRSNTIEIYVELKSPADLTTFLNFLSGNGIKTTFIDPIQSRHPDKNELAAILNLRLPKRQNHHEVISILNDAPGINYIEEV